MLELQTVIILVHVCNSFIFLMKGTKVFEKLSEVLTSTRLCNDLKKMSHLDQTSIVETFHSVMLYWCPKMLAFSDTGMLCRYVVFTHTSLLAFFSLNQGNIQNVTLSRGMSWMWGIYILRYRAIKVAKHVFHCFGSSKICHISRSRCSIVIEFGLKCSIFSGPIDHGEK